MSIYNVLYRLFSGTESIIDTEINRNTRDGHLNYYLPLIVRSRSR